MGTKKQNLAKSPNFSLVIDSEINHFLNLVIQMGMEHKDYARTLVEKDLDNASERFFKAMVRGCDSTDMEAQYANKPSAFGTKSKPNHRQLIQQAKNGATYTLEFDTKRDHVLNIMEQAAMSHPSFNRSLLKHGLEQVALDLMEEWAQKCHEAGMCDDPLCEWEKKSK